MKRYVYIIAMKKCGAPDEPLAFTHAFVDANTDDEAYDAGFESGCFERAQTGLLGFWERVNDYVVELPREGMA